MLSLQLLGQQNLVPNPSFEEFSSCPIGPCAVGSDELEKVLSWYKPNSSTTDYYNQCASQSSGVNVPSNWVGYQNAFDGSAYLGLGTLIPESPESAEYVQCKLLEPLKACHLYSFSMQINLADYSTHATNSFGVRLDSKPIIGDPILEFNGFELPCQICFETFITDTSSWVNIAGEYLAKGGEEYMTIGRFIDTSLYNNSDIPFVKVDCDSCFSWHDNVYYYLDDVNLNELHEQISISMPNVITPNQDGINDYWYPMGICFNDWKCDVLNRWGNTIFSFSENEQGWAGIDLKGSDLNEGTYFYRVYTLEQEITGFIELVR